MSALPVKATWGSSRSFPRWKSSTLPPEAEVPSFLVSALKETHRGEFSSALPSDFNLISRWTSEDWSILHRVSDRVSSCWRRNCFSERNFLSVFTIFSPCLCQWAAATCRHLSSSRRAQRRESSVYWLINWCVIDSSEPHRRVCPSEEKQVNCWSETAAAGRS